MREDATLLIVGTDSDAIVLEHQERQGFIHDLDWCPWPEPKVALIEIEEFLGDIMMMKDVKGAGKGSLAMFRERGITHVACLPANEIEGETMLFDKTSFSAAILLFYCAALNCYRMMHCGAEADLIAAWMNGMQGVWGLNESHGLQEEGATHH